MARKLAANPILIAAVLLLAFGGMVALKYSLRIVLLPLDALWMATGYWCWQIRPVPATLHALIQYADGLSREVRGRIVRVRELTVVAVQRQP